MATLKEIAREWASELREGIAWVIVWKNKRSWNAQAVWLNCEDGTFEPEDLELARKVLMQDKTAVMLNGYYCGRFFEEMTVADVAAAIRWHYENGYNQLDGSDAFPDELNQDAPDAAGEAQGTDGAAEAARPAWMNDRQYEDFRQACALIDTIKTAKDFYRVIDIVNNRFSLDVINAAREYKQCYNSGQYEQPQEWQEAASTAAGDTTQREAGTAAEAASEGQQVALGTPDMMAGTDTTTAADGQQSAPGAQEINLGKLYAETRPKAGGGLLAWKLKPP